MNQDAKSALMNIVNLVESLTTQTTPTRPRPRIHSFQPMKNGIPLSTTRLMNWPTLRERIYWNSNARISIQKKSLERGLTVIYATTSQT
jgi:hypothetical protein